MPLNTHRAFSLMQDCGLEAMIATSWINVAYFTEYSNWFDPLFRQYMRRPGAASWSSQAYALIKRDNPDPILVIGPVFTADALGVKVENLYLVGSFAMDLSGLAAGEDTDRTLVERFRTHGGFASPEEALKRVLQDHGLTADKIGMEKEGLNPEAAANLASIFGRQAFKDCSNLIRMTRMIKSQEEISRLRTAAEISETSFHAARGRLGAASDMETFKRVYHAGIAEKGAELDHFAYSVRGVAIATAPALRIDDNVSLYIDFGAKYKGYYSDTGLTIAPATLNPTDRANYQSLHESILRGVEVMKPGAKASEVRAAMREHLRSRGIVHSFPHGHGLGMEVRDYPIVVEDTGLRIADDCVDYPADLTFEPNMVMNLEGAIFKPGYGSMNHETTYLITEAGAVPLTTQNRSEPYIIQ